MIQLGKSCTVNRDWPTRGSVLILTRIEPAAGADEYQQGVRGAGGMCVLVRLDMIVFSFSFLHLLIRFICELITDASEAFPRVPPLTNTTALITSTASHRWNELKKH